MPYLLILNFFEEVWKISMKEKTHTLFFVITGKKKSYIYSFFASWQYLILTSHVKSEKSTIIYYDSFCSKVLEMYSLNLIIHCVKYLQVIFDHFNSYYESWLFTWFFFFFLPSNDILGGLPHIVTGIIVNFTGIIVNFTESPIQKIWIWYDFPCPQIFSFM